MEASLVMFLDEGTQQIHVVAGPELGDGLLIAPGMPIEAHVAVVIVLCLDHALFYCSKMNMQVKSPANLLTNFRCRGIGTYECETCIKKDGTNRLWLFKRH